MTMQWRMLVHADFEMIGNMMTEGIAGRIQLADF